MNMIVLVVIVFIVFAVYGFIKNENSPLVATKAVLIDKINDTHVHTDANGVASTTENLFLLFKLDTGSTIKLPVGGRIYRSIPKDEWGMLTFQGTRFVKFENSSVVVER